MALNLSGVFGDVANLASSVSLQDIVQQAAIGTAVTVAVAGAKSPDGQDALDPFQWFHHKPATPTAPAVNVVGTGGGVVTMSQFQKLTPDQQNMLVNVMHYSVMPG